MKKEKQDGDNNERKFLWENITESVLSPNLMVIIIYL